MTTEFRDVLERYSKKNPTLCLSTCVEGQPQSSLVYFALDENSNIYFLTKEETRKHKNLEKNSKVALMMQDIESQETLQIEGVAQKISDPSERKSIFDLLINNLTEITSWPPPIGRMEAGAIVLYRVKVNWARLGRFDRDGIDHFRQLVG